MPPLPAALGGDRPLVRDAQRCALFLRCELGSCAILLSPASHLALASAPLLLLAPAAASPALHSLLPCSCVRLCSGRAGLSLYWQHDPLLRRDGDVPGSRPVLINGCSRPLSRCSVASRRALDRHERRLHPQQLVAPAATLFTMLRAGASLLAVSLRPLPHPLLPGIPGRGGGSG